MAVEHEIRARLEVERPDAGIVGEEFGVSGNRRNRWLIDPIQGTHNLVRGDPLWAVMVALEVGGCLEVGVVSAPALGRRWWAARGLGAFSDGRLPVATSPLPWPELAVAEGSADIDPRLDARPWELAALSAILTEAGGGMTDLSGAPRIDGGSALVAQAGLHAELLGTAGPRAPHPPRTRPATVAEATPVSARLTSPANRTARLLAPRPLAPPPAFGVIGVCARISRRCLSSAADP